MRPNNPYHLLNQLRGRLAGIGAVSIIVLLICLLALHHYGLINLSIGVITALLGVGAIYKIYRSSQPNIQDALHLAHLQNPNIEYSGQLLLNDKIKTGLALLQKEKAAQEFGSVNYKLPWDYSMMKRVGLLILGLGIGAVSIQNLIVRSSFSENIIANESQTTLVNDIADILINDTTFITGLTITETPPSYTGLSPKSHRDANIQIVEGAKVKWFTKIQGEVDQLYFRFSEGDTIDITNKRQIQKEFFDADFYQYGFSSPSNDYVSDFHSIKIIKDQKPEVMISGIEEYVRLPWEVNHTISFDISVIDDYGLSEAYISATIAKGSGESVKFREREFKLKNYIPGAATYNSSFSFSTEKLEMEPGDELYFYVRAKDNYPYGDHSTKSVTHYISIQDTTTYEYADEGGMQVDLMPDFFRSQRQIIIDSEQLLKDKATISVDSFKRGSNELGFDQKMLRLKYGQFLGEENESGIAINNEIGEDHDDHDHEQDHAQEEAGASKALESARDLLSQYSHDHDHEEEEGLLMATKGTERRKEDPARPTWVEELSHNHDNTEEATFHNVSVKNKLRSALSVMWDAELHLRLYDPTTSLPFQRKSLILLQEIKTHARIYVHRIGFDPPSIKEVEVRMKGNQEKIDDRLNISNVDTEDDYADLKEIAAALGSKDLVIIKNQLDAAMTSLAKIALYRPEVLPVLSLANDINRNFSNATISDLNRLRQQIIKVIPNDASSINGTNKYAHELTLSVAKKLTN